MRRLWWLVIVLAQVAAPAMAQSADKSKGAVDGAVKTGVDAVVDSAVTIGRSTGALFKHGASAAKGAWHDNARTTAENARANGRATRTAARGETGAATKPRGESSKK